MHFQAKASSDIELTTVSLKTSILTKFSTYQEKISLDMEWTTHK